MNEIVNVAVNNGLGIASFIALIVFMKTTLKDMTQSLTDITKTLVIVQSTLVTLTERVSDMERQINK